MNTNSLKRFATVARNLLMQGVRSRLKAVGFNDDGSVRVEPKTSGSSAIFDGQVINDSRFVARWNALRDRIASHGVKEVVEEAAYTWFNRLMAIRILEYNSLAPALLDYENPEIRIPRIVTDARAGKTPVLSDEDRASLNAVIGNGRLSFEQFSILIRAYCENNPIIRKCFGGITDYTMLLLPADILAEDGFIDLLNKAGEFIAPEVYRKPELIGWLYQFYIAEKKDEVFAKKGGYDSDEIPAATQIFTPNWIVKYMVENTLGRIYLDNNPDSGLAENWKYLVEPAGRTRHGASLQYDSLEDLKCGDLSCGSGHILNEMFDLLMQLYEDDFYSPREAIESILTKNMVGIDIDDRARQLAQFALLLKACQRDSAFADGHCMPRIYSMPEVKASNWPHIHGEIVKAYSMVAPSQDSFNQVEKALELMEDANVLGSIMKFDISDETRQYIASIVSAYTESPRIIQILTERQSNTPGVGLIQTYLVPEESDKTQYFDSFAPIVDAFRVILVLTDKYAVLCMNPPYMPTNKEAVLKSYAVKEYPDSKSDLFAIFMDVAIDRLCEHGKYGMINMQSWMFLSSFETLRKKVIENQQIDSLLHLGSRTFDELSGEVVQNTAFVISRREEGRPRTSNSDIDTEARGRASSQYYRLIDGSSCNAKRDMFLAGENRHVVVDQKQFEQIPGAPIAYWVSDKIREIITNNLPLSAVCKPTQGLATADNGRFVRSWFEVSINSIGFGCKSAAASVASGRKFFPLNSGGTFRKWYGNLEFVLNWYNDGYELKSFPKAVVRNPDRYFIPGISWNRIASGDPSFRFVPDGVIFTDCSPTINTDKYYYFIGLLNSPVTKEILSLISPTLHFEVGQIGKIPIKEDFSQVIINDVVNCISISKQDWDAHETSWDFQCNELIALSNEDGEISKIDDAVEVYERKWTDLFKRLHANEEELNRQFIEIYGLQDELTPDVPLDEVTILQQGEISWEEVRGRTSLGGGAPSHLTHYNEARGRASSQRPLPAFLRRDEVEVHGTKLPHWNQDDTYVFITFRLGDSLPQDLLAQLKSERETWLSLHPQPWDKQTEHEYHRKFSHKTEEWLDNGYGSCLLKSPEASAIVLETMRHDDGRKYDLVDYVIMSNHVHALVRMIGDNKIQTLAQEWKSVSSHKLRKQFGAEWCGWMKNYYDRTIRDEAHFKNVISYIQKNYNQLGGGAPPRLTLGTGAPSRLIYEQFNDKEARGRASSQCASSQLNFNTDVIIKQFVSYAVGCMMGRYRLDRPGLAIAHPNPRADEYAPYVVPQTGQQWWTDDDGIVPMMGEDCGFHDNAANRFTEFVRVTFGDKYLTDNMNFVRDALGKDVVDYLRTDFYADHKRMYQNRPIYWMFSSNQKGKRAAFQCLVYMHRMNRFTPEHIRTNYLLPYIDHLAAREAELSGRSSLSAKENKRLKQLRSDLDECRDYQLRLHEFADRQIEIDLDEGVVKNYATFAPVLAKIK